MKLVIETQDYNPRRYGKPWIATVAFSDNKPSYNFGDWVGTAGGEGKLIIDANEGDIIARGQKDSRGNNNDIYYYILQADGERLKVSKIEAFDHYNSMSIIEKINPLANFSSEELAAEIERRKAQE